MLPAAEVLLLMLALSAIAALFVWLKNSRLVNRATHAIVDTPPDTDDELIGNVNQVVGRANQRATQLAQEADEARTRAERLGIYKPGR